MKHNKRNLGLKYKPNENANYTTQFVIALRLFKKLKTNK